MARDTGGREPLYLAIARRFERQIEEGALTSGDKLPSVRELSGRLGVSAGTAVTAYEWLERHGVVEVVPRSGHYVAVQSSPGEPVAVARRRPPSRPALAELVLEIQAAARDPRITPLGEALIRTEALPTARLNRAVRRVAAQFPLHAVAVGEPAGETRLRRQIARHSHRLACDFAPTEPIVTNGAVESLNLAVRAIAEPGDVVGVESPGCYEALRALETLGVRAVEIPVLPRRGPDLAEMERARRDHGVKAFLLSACCHNPLGYVLPDAAKADVVALAERLHTPIVEDDAFGDLAFSARRPKPFKAFDGSGNVLYCGSCSLVLAPGYHLAFVAPGRFGAEVEALKAMTAAATPALPQLAFAEFLAAGAFERHLRRLVTTLSRSTRQLCDAIARHFPPGTRATRPEGGFWVWVQLPGGRSGTALYRAALAAGIAIVPGAVFSPSRQFEECVRLAWGREWSADAERAVATLGALAAGDRAQGASSGRESAGESRSAKRSGQRAASPA